MNRDTHEQIPCPDGIPGCAVLHYRKKVKQMKDLRERCEKLYQSLAGHMVTECLERTDCDRIEAFARELLQQGRQEVLNHMSKHEDDYNDIHEAVKDLREFVTHALAASEDEK